MTRARTLANLLTTSGRIVQVVQGQKTDTQSITANLATKDTVTGLNASITPTSSDSKI